MGLRHSEPMLFGLGQGLGFIYWKTKAMPAPFLGGRIQPDRLTANLARNLGVTLTVKETSSRAAAWEKVKALVDGGKAVGLKLDCFHLEYFGTPFHFAGHYVALYGYDDERAYLVDTRQQGGAVETSLASLARARAERGPMSSRNLYYTLDAGKAEPDLRKAAAAALEANAREYLAAPIANLGWRGIARTAGEIGKWFAASSAREEEFTQAALMMERAGTGGALFRNIYRDFLAECRDLIKDRKVAEAHAAFVEIAPLWTEVAGLFDRAGRTGQAAPIDRASALLKEISALEKAALEGLA